MMVGIVVCLLAVLSYFVQAGGALSDVTILLEATAGLDVQGIKQLTHTHAVYKIKASMNGSSWNYAVFGKNLPSIKDLNSYVAAVKSLPTITKSETIPMQPDTSGSVTVMNLMVKAVRLMDKIFGFLPKRPLKPLTPPITKCDTVQVASEKQPLTVLAFLRPKKDQSALRKYSWIALTKIFPTLNARQVYEGYPSSKTWPLFDIQQYDSKSTLCEYVLSEFVLKYADLYTKAYDGMSSYTAVEL